MYEIVNKIVLITGAANGIGAEVVKILLKEGAKVKFNMYFVFFFFIYLRPAIIL